MVTLLLLVAAVCCLMLGTVVLIQNIRQFTNALFFLICLCFGVWAVSVLVFLNTSDGTVAYLSAKAFYLAAGIFPALLFIFASVFPSNNYISNFTRAAVIIIALVINIAIIFDSNFIISQLSFSAVGPSVEIDLTTYLIYSVYFVVIFSASIYIALRRFYKSKGKLRMQAGLYAWGLLLNGIPGLITNLFLPFFSIYSYIWVGPVASVFFLGFTTYSIVRHSLFDIKFAAVRTLAYVLSLMILGGVYYLFAYVVSLTLFGGDVNSTFSVNPINILLALILAFVFQPIKAFFDRATDRVFFRDRYNSDNFYARVSEVLTSTTELRKLLERAALEIGTTLKAEQTFFFVQYSHTHRVTAGTQHHSDIPVKDIHDLNEYVEASGSEIIVRDMPSVDSHIQRILSSHKIAILMPLVRHKQTLGYLCLGDQRASGYTKRDVRVLETIADELVIAIQNSLSVQEVRDINANLEQRIETATAELRTTNARLRRLDAAKDEFLSMASHQLRTPLTSVKGYLSMMLDGDMGEISPMQKKVLEEAFGSSERMVHLIHDFLNVSRLQTGKFMLELADMSLPKLVAEEVKSLEQVAKSRSMKLDFVNNVGEMTLELDDTKIRQVVMNYIDNAIYYSHPDSTITITLDKTNEQVQLRVKDTGIGVPKSEQEHLFGKFYRATNARKQRPDGTGVGIYLAKKVVTALGGDIIFDSKEGKGSTFGFWLPLK